MTILLTAPTVITFISEAPSSGRTAGLSVMVAKAVDFGAEVVHVAGPGISEAAEATSAVLDEVRRRVSQPEVSMPPFFLTVDIDQVSVRHRLPREFPPGSPEVMRWRAVAKAQENIRSSLTQIAAEGPSVGVSVAVVTRNPAASDVQSLLAAVTSTIRSRSPD